MKLNIFYEDLNYENITQVPDYEVMIVVTIRDIQCGREQSTLNYHVE